MFHFQESLPMSWGVLDTVLINMYEGHQGRQPRSLEKVFVSKAQCSVIVGLAQSNLLQTRTRTRNCGVISFKIKSLGPFKNVIHI